MGSIEEEKARREWAEEMVRDAHALVVAANKLAGRVPGLKESELSSYALLLAGLAAQRSIGVEIAASMAEDASEGEEWKYEGEPEGGESGDDPTDLPVPDGFGKGGLRLTSPSPEEFRNRPRGQ